MRTSSDVLALAVDGGSARTQPREGPQKSKSSSAFSDLVQGRPSDDREASLRDGTAQRIFQEIQVTPPAAERKSTVLSADFGPSTGVVLTVNGVRRPDAPSGDSPHADEPQDKDLSSNNFLPAGEFGLRLLAGVEEERADIPAFKAQEVSPTFVVDPARPFFVEFEAKAAQDIAEISQTPESASVNPTFGAEAALLPQAASTESGNFPSDVNDNAGETRQPITLLTPAGAARQQIAAPTKAPAAGPQPAVNSANPPDFLHLMELDSSTVSQGAGSTPANSAPPAEIRPSHPYGALGPAISFQKNTDDSFGIASLTKRDRGGFELRLDPPDLGVVSIEFAEERNGLQIATVTSERAETLELLRRHTDVFLRELGRHGAGEFEIRFRDQSDNTPFDAERKSARPLRVGEISGEPVEESALYHHSFSSDRIDLLA